MWMLTVVAISQIGFSFQWREYDSSGLFIQDNIKSSCCREPLCNNINYFRLLKNKKGNENNNLDQQLISDAVFLIFCVILSMIIIIAELLYRKPMIGRIEKKSYKKRNIAELNKLTNLSK
ncbi:hypothetical protein L3Y34_015732 [Caenorhabditis briggsae]|uniref:Uncharacterized protein n=1 Tax=Caenorhabditis briggsae TaxID=6238 RepID=A0AAE9IZQ3_CAEBR|nr:hypothetical protein L3Y34_015732 [Caenorhabditis briggsae]